MRPPRAPSRQAPTASADADADAHADATDRLLRSIWAGVRALRATSSRRWRKKAHRCVNIYKRRYFGKRLRRKHVLWLQNYRDIHRRGPGRAYAGQERRVRAGRRYATIDLFLRKLGGAGAGGNERSDDDDAA